MTQLLDAVACHAKLKGRKNVGLTGTRFTMSDDFYARELERLGLAVKLPDAIEQEIIHRIIYDELILGTIKPASASKFMEISQRLVTLGAEAILLGCTNLEMLIRKHTSALSFIDSTTVHANTAWEISIGRSSLFN